MTFTDEQNALLEAKLDGEAVKPPPRGKYGEYLEGWHVIAEANRIFGHDGWSYSVVTMTQTNSSVNGDKHAVGFMCHVRVEAGGAFREDFGHGQGHSKSEGDAYDSAIKEAVTDALKRSLRSFGWPFGLALYDKTKEHVDTTGGAQLITSTNIAPNAMERAADDLIVNVSSCETADELTALKNSDEFKDIYKRLSSDLKERVNVAGKNMAEKLQEKAA